MQQPTAGREQEGVWRLSFGRVTSGFSDNQITMDTEEALSRMKRMLG